MSGCGKQKDPIESGKEDAQILQRNIKQSKLMTIFCS